MKKYFLLLFVFVAPFLSSCRKNVIEDTGTPQSQLDDQIIQDYIKANNLTVIKDPSGMYYQIINPGTGAHPTDVSNIAVGYTLSLVDNIILENKASTYFSPLSSLIQGWRIGLPKIGTGGSILLIIPSALGYGNTATGSVPVNSVLVYRISLQGFN